MKNYYVAIQDRTGDSEVFIFKSQKERKLFLKDLKELDPHRQDIRYALAEGYSDSPSNPFETEGMDNIH